MLRVLYQGWKCYPTQMLIVCLLATAASGLGNQGLKAQEVSASDRENSPTDPITSEFVSTSEDATKQILQQVEEYNPLNLSQQGNQSLDRVNFVNQLEDVKPTDWAYQALQNLAQRHQCLLAYPDNTYRGNRAMTRYEFAAGLDACLEQIQRQLATVDTGVSGQDLQTLRRLQEEFVGELTLLRRQVDAIEVRTAELEANQFSTTTKLSGEVAFGLSAPLDDSNNETVFQQRVRLALNTSFMGDDLLVTRLTAGNAAQFSYAGGTPENTHTYGLDTGNTIQGDWIAYYTPPINDKLQVYIPAVGGLHVDYAPSISPYLDDYTGASGTLSFFAESSPIYKIGGGSGIAGHYVVNDSLALSLGYLAGGSNSPGSPTTQSGIFNGDYSVLSQISLSLGEKFSLGLTYNHGYHIAGSQLFDLGGGGGVVGTSLANLPSNAAHVTNTYGVETAFEISPNFGVNAFVGYTDVDIVNSGNAEVWFYGLGLAFPDLGAPGNLAGIAVGAQPYVGGYDEVAAPAGFKNDIPLHVEAFYKYQVMDNISVTPGFIWLNAPNQDKDNEDAFIGTLRTTFTF